MLLTFIFRPACFYGCLWAFIHNLFKNFLTFFFYCVILYSHEGHLNLRIIPFVNYERNFLLPFEKGGSKTLSLTNDLVYPQYLVLGFVRDSNGNLIQSTSVSVFATRSDALSFINCESARVSCSLRSDAFDSYSDYLSPVFRLYHLTRSKI